MEGVEGYTSKDNDTRGTQTKRDIKHMVGKDEKKQEGIERRGAPKNNTKKEGKN